VGVARGGVRGGRVGGGLAVRGATGVTVKASACGVANDGARRVWRRKPGAQHINRSVLERRLCYLR